MVCTTLRTCTIWLSRRTSNSCVIYSCAFSVRPWADCWIFRSNSARNVSTTRLSAYAPLPLTAFWRQKTWRPTMAMARTNWVSSKRHCCFFFSYDSSNDNNLCPFGFSSPVSRLKIRSASTWVNYFILICICYYSSLTAGSPDFGLTANVKVRIFGLTWKLADLYKLWFCSTPSLIRLQSFRKRMNLLDFNDVLFIGSP